MHRAPFLRSLLVSATFLLGGCLSLVIPDHATAPATTDDATVKQMLSRGDFMGPGFVQVNRTPFASDLEEGRVVTMYVSADAAAAYEAISPDVDSSKGPAFPVGGMIVRTSTDGAGTLQALTFMVKHEPGYFPEVGDFLFGVSAPDGTPALDALGGTEWGKLTDCATCHEQRSGTGFLFGVTTAHR